MSRVAAEHFEGKEISRIYIAASLNESSKIEEILSNEEIDYFIEIEDFLPGVLTSPTKGAAFYVLAGQARYCRQHIIVSGFSQGVTMDD